MQRPRQLWVCGLTLACLLTNGHLAAQTPGQGAVVSSPSELAPRLLSGPTGEVFRLWQREGDFREGGGGVFLATASAQHAWHTLLEILPQEKGITPLDPDVAVGPAGELAVAYQWRRHVPRSKQIRLARSVDGGKTWTQSVTPVDSSGAAFSPKLGWGRGRSLVVAWADERGHAGRTWDIYARRSPDGGATWEPEQLLSRVPGHTRGDYVQPEMVSDGENSFWIVWVAFRPEGNRLYLSRSTDGGQTWADPVDLSGPTPSMYGRRLIRSGTRLLLVWHDLRTSRNRIYAVSSADRGVTWTAPTRVDHLPAEDAAHAHLPEAVMSPAGEVFVTWYDGRHGRNNVFVGRSGDGGRTWDHEDLRLDTDDPGTGVSQLPTVARATDGRIAVAWANDRAGHEGIYLRVRGTGAHPTWGPEILVAPPGPKKAARTPRLLWGRDGSLYVTWEVWDYTLGPLALTKRIDGRTLVLDKK